VRSPFTPALAGAVVLSFASLLVSPGTAMADDDCRPTIDADSISVSPTTVAITSKGSAVLEASADFTAPCAEDDGSDLSAAAVFYTPDEDSSYVLDTSVTGEGITRADDSDGYRFADSLRVRASKLQNSDAGSWTADVYAFDDQDQDTNDYVSEGATLKVLRAAKLTVNAGPEPARAGKTITVKGKLSRADWEKGKDGAYGHRSVKLQFKPGSGSYTTVASVTSSSKGNLKASVKASEDGSFRFVFTGSSTTAGTTSAADHVDVQ
jgi:hypothetical protein